MEGQQNCLWWQKVSAPETDHNPLFPTHTLCLKHWKTKPTSSSWHNQHQGNSQCVSPTLWQLSLNSPGHAPPCSRNTGSAPGPDTAGSLPCGAQCHSTDLFSRFSTQAVAALALVRLWNLCTVGYKNEQLQRDFKWLCCKHILSNWKLFHQYCYQSWHPWTQETKMNKTPCTSGLKSSYCIQSD